ncbi:MAG: hypothetical protein ABS76_26510 [Pelagibacterium sp. SCN 64-44]|nr:MAG: hypothetical protein ABS76_26510 [Pelagibacterium sp. SCN 64-44]
MTREEFLAPKLENYAKAMVRKYAEVCSALGMGPVGAMELPSHDEVVARAKHLRQIEPLLPAYLDLLQEMRERAGDTIVDEGRMSSLIGSIHDNEEKE